MAEFFTFLFVASLGGFVASMSKPSIFSKMRISTRKTGASLFGGLAIFSLILLGSTAPDTTV